MPILQRRPRQRDEDLEDQDQERPRQRQRRIDRDESVGPDEDENPGIGERADESTETQLVKKLVRYALACDYSRTPIRRDGIKEKVLGAHSRSFRKVFECAQKQLRAVFGMELVELPVRDKSTMSVEEQRRAAKSQSKGPTSSNTYMLVTVLAPSFRTASITAPSCVRGAEAEAIRVGLYSFVVTIITLNRGELSDQKLKRYLQRVNADRNTPLEKTDVMLQSLIRQGYISKTVEKNLQGDEDSVAWHVGPRGRQEVTGEAMASIVREVYGNAVDDELERKLRVSLGIDESRPPRGDGGGAIPSRSGAGNSRRREAHADDEE